MSHFQYYFLTGMMNLATALFIILITVSAVMKILKDHFPYKYRSVLNKIKKQTKVGRWEAKGMFDKIAFHYEKLSKKKEKSKFFLLGLSSLYKYDHETACEYFDKHLRFAIGKTQILRTKNYLGTALLQGKSYSQALTIYEECRREGSVSIIPYVFSLLLSGQKSKARDFYELYPVSKWADPFMRKLLAFDKSDSKTLSIILEELEHLDNRLFLYRSTIEEIIAQYRLEEFFQSDNHLQTLQVEISSILHQISNHPSYFQSPQLQWVRKLLNEYESRILTKQIVWFDEIEPLIESFKINELNYVFKKIHWMKQNHTKIIKKDEYEKFLKAVLPSSAKETISYDYHVEYHLYDDEKSQIGFEFISNNREHQQKLKLIHSKEANILKDLSLPLIAHLKNVPSELQDSFHRIIFELFLNRKYIDHWRKNIIPYIENLPQEYQSYFNSIKEHFN